MQKINIKKSIPLQSNDAFIAASASNQSASLLTFDKDFMKTTIIDSIQGPVLNVYSVKMKNNDLFGSESQKLIEHLDGSLKHIIEKVVGGPGQFEEKFGISND
ncbi:PIN domain-containing protein [Rossellomorea vietnamensis]|uniref:Uncharacterized protein n=1 Tax=Rossellomorea vietnamensis TaxID=218284 RepID=A0A0P6VUU7_9BACI|nr:PIN domain-containing protein [Rossellomorea vietnamensis]KPL58440.1 hypothetical protein AM506_16410 [Rossellomorea vietnamensis]